VSLNPDHGTDPWMHIKIVNLMFVSVDRLHSSQYVRETGSLINQSLVYNFIRQMLDSFRIEEVQFGYLYCDSGTEEKFDLFYW